MQQAIANFGTQEALAEALDVSQPTVSGWARGERPVPPKRCIAIEVHPKNRAAERPVMRWDLRPNDWWDEWPDMVGSAGAPVPDVAAPAPEAAEAGHA